MTYEIYWNLHRRKFSIRQDGRVIGHVDSINAFETRLVVQPAGRERVRRTGKKNVHAFVRARYVEVLEPGAPHMMFARTRVTYNPYTHEQFEPIQMAEAVSLRARDGHAEIFA